MGLKIETWSIAYRQKSKGIFNKTNPFTVINNGHKGWYADPFLFDYNGETYLFAEYFSYKLNRGVLVYSKFNKIKNMFSPYKQIIVEGFHLSYPVVFEYNGKIYMMPETSAAGSLYLYEAVSFPEKWNRLPAVMSDIKLVDTTPIVINDKLFALTLRLHEDDHNFGDLLLLEYDGKRFNISSQGVLSQDMSISRPGGNFILDNNKIYRVSQDCDGSYGKAVNIIEMSDDFVNKFGEKIVEKISPKDIILKNKNFAEGIHTYNVSNELEVVDLKYYKNCYFRLFYRLFK